MKFNAKIFITLGFLLSGILVATLLVDVSFLKNRESNNFSLGDGDARRAFYNYSPKEIKISGANIEVSSVKREDGLEYEYRTVARVDSTLIYLPYLSLGRYEIRYFSDGVAAVLLFSVGLKDEVLESGCMDDVGRDLSFAFFREFAGACVFGIVESKNNPKESLEYFQNFFTELSTDGVFQAKQLMICQRVSEILGESLGSIYGFDSAVREGVKYNYCESGQHYIRGVYSSVTSSFEDLDKYLYKCQKLFDSKNSSICYSGFHKFLSNQYLYDIEKVLLDCKGDKLGRFFESYNTCIFVMFNSYLEDMHNFFYLSKERLVEGTDIFAQVNNLFKTGLVYKSCELLEITDSLGCFQSTLFMTLGIHPAIVTIDKKVGPARDILREYTRWCNELEDSTVCGNAVDYSLGKLVYLFPEEEFPFYCKEFSVDATRCFFEATKYRANYKASIT